MESMHWLVIAQGEMGDTAQLYKLDDFLPRQTHAHAACPRSLVNWLNYIESELPPETRLAFAYGKHKPSAPHQSVLWDRLHIVLLPACYYNSFLRSKESAHFRKRSLALLTGYHVHQSSSQELVCLVEPVGAVHLGFSVVLLWRNKAALYYKKWMAADDLTINCEYSWHKSHWRSPQGG